MEKMEQINFRIFKDEKEVIATLAKKNGVSVAEFVKQAVMREITDVRVDLAFDLLDQGKISRKRAWVLSGLSGFEFRSEWSKRGAEEKIPDSVIKKQFDTIHDLDISRLLKPGDE